MKSEVFQCASQSRRMSSAAIEPLESRRLFHAVIPAGYTALETVQIRAAAGTYPSDLTLLANTNYFLLATGTVETSANVLHGDAAFIAGSTSATAETTTWGITATAGNTTTTTADWGAFQGDAIYGQNFITATTGNLSFAFANDGTDTISTLAVTVYAAIPAIKVATIRTDNVTGSIAVSSLPSNEAFIPLNNADFDHNGVADDQQGGRVVGDKFLLPITLPAIPGDTASSSIQIHAPKGLRVWMNPDRTGSTVGVDLPANVAHTVYLEATAEQPKNAPVNLKIFLPFSGVSVEQTIPVVAFSLGGPTTATGGTKQVFSSDAPTGKWLTADGGTLDTSTVSIVKKVAYANVVWNNTTAIGYVDFDADSDFIWGWPVEVTA
jgi:hypothetical protein